MLSINDLMTGAKVIYTLVEDFKDNQKQLKTLAEDIKAVVEAVAKKETEFFDAEGKLKKSKKQEPDGKALQMLNRCISDAKEIIKKLKGRPDKTSTEEFIQFLSKLVQATGYKKEIAEIYKNLDQAKQTLNLAVTLHSEEYLKELKTDISLVITQLDEVEASVKSLDKIDGIEAEIQKIRAGLDSLRTSLVAEEKEKQTTGPKQTVKADSIEDSDIRSLNIEGLKGYTLPELSEASDKGFERFRLLRDQDAKNQKDMASGVSQTIEAKTISRTQAYTVSFTHTPSSTSSATTVTPSPLTGRGSPSTFVVTQKPVPRSNIPTTKNTGTFGRQ